MSTPSVAAIVLAAGRSIRMGTNKMLAEIGGEPLILLTLRSLLRSRARPLILVTGHESEKLLAAVAGLEIGVVSNPRYREGLATSLAAGLAAVPAEAPAALICLGDMPLIGHKLVDALIARSEERPEAAAVVPAHGGEWGNPVLIARKLFPEVAALKGDAGARRLLRGRDDVALLDAPDASVLLDADTPEALAELRARLGRA
jgi:molybdenum cofactor cytidylyltransferase